MADLASTDLTYTSVRKAEIGRISKTVLVDVAFGDGALTYPNGGVPLDKAKLGFRDHVDSIKIVNPSHGDARGDSRRGRGRHDGRLSCIGWRRRGSWFERQLE